MKRTALISLLLLVASLLAACGATGDETARNTVPSAAPSPAAPLKPSRPAPLPDEPPVSAAHGSATKMPTAPTGAASNTAEKSEIDTSALDAQIERAETKAKAAKATDADRRAAAEAYFERGYKFYGAQNPRLYKFALGDFRRVLRYQPDHREAAAIIKQIEDIYRSMGRPIPTNGLEP
ncbi:MAG TPA: hypothetical protein VF666_06015 [Pyrinomonadaceae bacterium]|jgi:hypothetical protein